MPDEPQTDRVKRCFQAWHGAPQYDPHDNVMSPLHPAAADRCPVNHPPGGETPGELAEDGVPEPLRVQLNERTSVMYVPTGGFVWITDGRATAEPGTSECLLSLQVGTTNEVDELVGHVDAAGGRVVSGPEQKSYG